MNRNTKGFHVTEDYKAGQHPTQLGDKILVVLEHKWRGAERKALALTSLLLLSPCSSMFLWVKWVGYHDGLLSIYS